MPETPSLFYTFHFYLFGVLAIAAALTFVTRKSPGAAVLWLVVTMFSLAGMYVMLDAHFIGAVQVLVYAGAIMVVFLFVIMLLNLGDPKDLVDARTGGWKLLAGLVGLALLAQLFALSRTHIPVQALDRPGGAIAAEVARDGAIRPVARLLFTDYLLAFEVTSVLLLAAVVGAVVVGRSRRAGSEVRSTTLETGHAR